jgi:DNA-binding GntR family transcriptional regulator
MYTEAVVRAAAARIATPKISSGTLDEMTRLVEELERDPGNADPEDQLALARQFDDHLLAAAGNDVLAGLIDTVSVFGWSLRIRAVRAMHDEPEVGLSRIRNHREILTALRARDADRVEALVRDHVTTAIGYFLEQAP